VGQKAQSNVERYQPPAISYQPYRKLYLVQQKQGFEYNILSDIELRILRDQATRQNRHIWDHFTISHIPLAQVTS
jgi:hypothetical protein